MNNIWWRYITRANLFAQNIVDCLINEQSVALYLPRYVPWYDTLFYIIEDGVVNNGLQREIKIIDDSDDEPGRILMNLFCKKEIRAQYRIGKSYATFLGQQQASTLSSAVVWVRGLTANRLSQWQKFIPEYKRAVSKNNSCAVFVLEVRNDSIQQIPGGVESISFDSSISAYDKYTFCALGIASTGYSTSMKAYLAELISNVCTNDVELCAACIRYGIQFAKNPLECLQLIESTENHSDGTPYDVEDAIKELDYHIWESQIRMIYPMIEKYRSDFVNQHRRDIQKALPIENDFGDLIETPEDAEIGLLYSLTAQGAIQMMNNDEYSILRHYKEARNSLAHIKPLGYDEIDRIIRCI